MQSSPSLAVQETPKIQRTAEPRQLGLGPVPAKRPKPTISQLAAVMDAFNIRGTARLVSYELLSYWEPGGKVFPLVKTIAGRIGKSERVVQRQLEHLERVGVWVRCGPAPIGVKGKQPSLYEMRLPQSSGVTPASPHGVTPASPRSNQREVDVQPPRDKMSGPTEMPALPEHLTAIEGGHGVKCRRCDHEWPRGAGLNHICVGRRTEQPSRQKQTRKGRSTSMTDRYAAEYLARKRREKAAAMGGVT